MALSLHEWGLLAWTADYQTIHRLLVVSCVFLLVLSVWGGVVLLWYIRRSASHERIQARLDAFHQAPASGDVRVLRLWRGGREATTTVPGLAPKPTLRQRLEEMRTTAGIRAPLVTLFLYAIGAATTLAAVTLAIPPHQPLVAGSTAVIVLVLSWVAFRQRVNTRVSVFELQLVDALELAARCLRAGHPLHGAFRLIAEEIPAPVGAIFGQINQEQSLGVSLEEALRKAAGAATHGDLKLFATSVMIQTHTGGNLADMMERLALVIRERMRLARRVRVLTAQTQFSKWILLALPLVLLVFLNWMNPHYMSGFFRDPTGQIALGVGAGLIIVGTLIMNRLSLIRY